MEEMGAEPPLIISFFSLFMIPASGNEEIPKECNLKEKTYNCKDLKIKINKGDFFNGQNVNLIGNATLDIQAGNGLNEGTYNTMIIKDGQPGDVQLDVNASSGINNLKLLIQNVNTGVVNANKGKAINGGSQTFNAGTILNINAADGVFNSTGLTFTDATLNLNAKNAFNLDCDGY